MKRTCGKYVVLNAPFLLLLFVLLTSKIEIDALKQVEEVFLWTKVKENNRLHGGGGKLGEEDSPHRTSR